MTFKGTYNYAFDILLRQGELSETVRCHKQARLCMYVESQHWVGRGQTLQMRLAILRVYVFLEYDVELL